ncbi:translation initiation factor IF-2 N-terminal domain-containing protein [Thermococcus aciditolerans]|uniref:DUF4405 domain-containing protein n=1 Tax=Thermococcus aciditolerans TaxID=2598455 RepID=A0A5C0SLS8_9EURY|nr:translation initiation factor IF-2 N-terminal domain-containing protein [Thermococcus aciditolerans]QEK14394.1 DUF4405 domain-containing protein [Thermococcus aciditolerans]
MRASALIRGVIDLLLTVVFVVVLVTGIGLYLAPSGRIAESIGWTFLGLDKDTLTLVHTYLGFVMAGLVAVHLAIGVKSMWVMLKSAFRSSKLKAVSAVVVPIILLAAGYQVFAGYSGSEETSTVEYTSDVTGDVYITGTMMKYYTVQQLADEFNVEVTDLIGKLRENGIDASPDETLAEIEYKYGLDGEEFKAILEEAIAELRGGD